MSDQSAEGLLSPWLRENRVRRVLPHLWGRVLDVGCGSGGLAGHIAPENYLGVEPDRESIQIARSTFPRHMFREELPSDGIFDTIVGLAVIEHVARPQELLHSLVPLLRQHPRASIMLTTPAPAFGWLHTIGAAIGLFSTEASQEHQRLLGRTDLADLADDLDEVRLADYGRFLFGANQLAVYRRVAR